jgi:PTH1 family peptidyl-tRNA hydrolase
MRRIVEFLGQRFARHEEAPAPHRLIVGLGNPGPQYASTRHNAGFRVVERLASRAGTSWRREESLEALVAEIELAGQACLLLQPQAFMNRSGRSVEAALARWPALVGSRDLLIIYDDLDLPPGRLRLRPAGGAGGHRGIGDILEVLQTREVPRLRFGVGHPGKAGGSVVDWVLAEAPPQEEALIAQAVDRAADAVEAVVDIGLSRAMGQFNSDP